MASVGKREIALTRPLKRDPYLGASPWNGQETRLQGPAKHPNIVSIPKEGRKATS